MFGAFDLHDLRVLFKVFLFNRSKVRNNASRVTGRDTANVNDCRRFEQWLSPF